MTRTDVSTLYTPKVRQNEPFSFDLFIMFITQRVTESNTTCKHSQWQIRLGFPFKLNSFYVNCLLLLFG